MRTRTRKGERRFVQQQLSDAAHFVQLALGRDWDIQIHSTDPDIAPEEDGFWFHIRRTHRGIERIGATCQFCGDQMPEFEWGDGYICADCAQATLTTAHERAAWSELDHMAELMKDQA